MLSILQCECLWSMKYYCTDNFIDNNLCSKHSMLIIRWNLGASEENSDKRWRFSTSQKSLMSNFRTFMLSSPLLCASVRIKCIWVVLLLKPTNSIVGNLAPAYSKNDPQPQPTSSTLPFCFSPPSCCSLPVISSVTSLAKDIFFMYDSSVWTSASWMMVKLLSHSHELYLFKGPRWAWKNSVGTS